MTTRQAPTIFAGITRHLFVVLATISLVFAGIASLALGVTDLGTILVIFLATAAIVAVSFGILMIGVILALDSEPIERVLNGIIRMMLPRKSVSTGAEGVIGACGEVIQPFCDIEGHLRSRVRIGSEIWNAELDADVQITPGPGETVEVTVVDGLCLTVRPRVPN